MNKKNKRKQVRKILPVLLALVVMFSAFTVSAFADEYDDWDCDLNGHYIGGCSFNGVEGECVAVCDICGIDLKLYATVPYIPSFECGTGLSFVSMAAYDARYEDGEYCIETTYFCSCDETHLDCNDVLFTPIVDTPEAENPSIITSIATDLVGSIGVFLGGIGKSLVTFFDTVVTTTNAEGKRTLTAFAGWSIAFLGIGFGSMFIRKLMKKAS